MNRSLQILASLVLLALFLFLAYGSSDQPGTVEPKHVEYRVVGDHFDLTYNNSQGNTEQREHQGNWSYEFTTSDRNFFAYVSAQNQRKWGSITTEIWIDGVKVETATSSGAYKIATASRRVY